MLSQDIRHALRGLRRSPGTTAVSVLTLALGIGAVTAIASVIDGVLLRNLSYAEPYRVLYVGETMSDGSFTSVSYENFVDFNGYQPPLNEIDPATLVSSVVAIR